jgi:hypothetical protein
MKKDSACKVVFEETTYELIMETPLDWKWIHVNSKPLFSKTWFSLYVNDSISNYQLIRYEGNAVFKFPTTYVLYYKDIEVPLMSVEASNIDLYIMGAIYKTVKKFQKDLKISK